MNTINADNMTGYISNQFDKNSSMRSISYPTDYLGSIQLLEKAGFTSYPGQSTINSTLNQIFDRFVQKTGLDTTANKLKDEFLENNPATQHALDIYGTLENTFSAKGEGEKAAIVDFLNSKIDSFITENDSDKSQSLSYEESKLSDTLFNTMDKNRDKSINAEEIQNNFYSDFNQLNNVLNYFQRTPGVLLDTYA